MDKNKIIKVLESLELTNMADNNAVIVGDTALVLHGLLEECVNIEFSRDSYIGRKHYVHIGVNQVGTIVVHDEISSYNTPFVTYGTLRVAIPLNTETNIKDRLYKVLYNKVICGVGSVIDLVNLVKVLMFPFNIPSSVIAEDANYKVGIIDLIAKLEMLRAVLNPGRDTTSLVTAITYILIKEHLFNVETQSSDDAVLNPGRDTTGLASTITYILIKEHLFNVETQSSDDATWKHILFGTDDLPNNSKMSVADLFTYCTEQNVTVADLCSNFAQYLNYVAASKEKFEAAELKRQVVMERLMSLK